MAFAYQQNVFEGASYGYVKYDISPDIGTPVAADALVTVTGQAYLRDHASKSLSLMIHGTGMARDAWVNVSIPRAKVTSFTLRFPMWALDEDWGTGRVYQLPFTFSFNMDVDGGGGGTGTTETAGQYLSYMVYPLSPTVRFAAFERYGLSDGSYVKDDEGQYALGRLGISLAEERDASDLTVKRVVVADDAGNSQTLALSNAVLASALTSAGYVESSPGLFAAMQFNTGRNYTLSFTIGDAFETATATVLVARAFANLHLSGASTGGVAFGRFSTATEGHPRLECAYPAAFEAGILDFGGTIQSGVTAEVSVSAGQSADIAVSFGQAYSAAPFVLVGFESGYIAGAFGKCCCAVLQGSVTANGFTARAFNGDSSARAIGVRWLAIGVV